MGDLSAVGVDELRSRMNAIFTDLESAFQRIGPELKKIGDLRQEAGIIYDELKARGLLKESDGGARSPV